MNKYQCLVVLFVTSPQTVSLAESLSGDANSLLLKTNESEGLGARGRNGFADLDLGAKVAVASSAISTVGKLARGMLLLEAAVAIVLATEATEFAEFEAEGTKALGTLVVAIIATSVPVRPAESKVETAEATESTEIF